MCLTVLHPYKGALSLCQDFFTKEILNLIYTGTFPGKIRDKWNNTSLVFKGHFNMTVDLWTCLCSVQTQRRNETNLFGKNFTQKFPSIYFAGLILRLAVFESCPSSFLFFSKSCRHLPLLEAICTLPSAFQPPAGCHPSSRGDWQSEGAAFTFTLFKRWHSGFGIVRTSID